MSDAIQEGKYVELTYKVVDQNGGEPLIAIEYPIAYIHGMNDVLAPPVLEELLGKQAGDVIEVPIDCNLLYGERDESLVFTDRLESVPEEYREVGTTITMEGENGKTRTFIVTRMDDQTLTVDGNNPLSGRNVIFILEILTVRDASEEELEAGGPLDSEPDLDEILSNPGTTVH